MSQSINFWAGCWIYTNKIERENMRFIISYLKKNRSVCLSELQRRSPRTRHAIRNALLYLLVARVVKVEQHGDVRVYKFNEGWIEKLKKAMTPYSKGDVTSNSYKSPLNKGSAQGGYRAE